MPDKIPATKAEAAKILIGSFKEFMKDKKIEIRCPSNHTMFFKFLVDRQLIEIHCRECSKKWGKLKSMGSRNIKSFIFHRYDVKMNLVETVIVDGNQEKIIERK